MGDGGAWEGRAGRRRSARETGVTGRRGGIRGKWVSRESQGAGREK